MLRGAVTDMKGRQVRLTDPFISPNAEAISGELTVGAYSFSFEVPLSRVPCPTCRPCDLHRRNGPVQMERRFTGGIRSGSARGGCDQPQAGCRKLRGIPDDLQFRRTV